MYSKQGLINYADEVIANLRLKLGKTEKEPIVFGPKPTSEELAQFAIDKAKIVKTDTYAPHNNI